VLIYYFWSFNKHGSKKEILAPFWQLEKILVQSAKKTTKNGNVARGDWVQRYPYTLLILETYVNVTRQKKKTTEK